MFSKKFYAYQIDGREQNDLLLFWRAFSADGDKVGQMVFYGHKNLEKYHLRFTNLHYLIGNDLAK
jgi:hypothetical protein